MSRPPADPTVMRAMKDEDWEKNPAVTRLGAEQAIRRERLAARTRPSSEGLAGTAARSATGMAALRAKLNSIRSSESKSGTTNSSTFSSIVESARTTQEPFAPKSSVTVAVTPTTRTTFAARCAPIAAKCGVDWIKTGRSRYSSQEPVQAVLQVIAPVKDDARQEDIDALQAVLDKVKPMIKMLNDEEDFAIWYGIEEVTATDASGSPLKAARGLHKKQLALRVFIREEDMDIPYDLTKEIGGSLWGDLNPLLNHMDCLVKGFSMKFESGQSFTETLVSRDAAAKPLGDLRVTTKAEFSSELASKLYPANLKALINLSSGGYSSRRQRDALNASMASTLPLLAVKNIDTHLTYDSPEHLLFNLIRQLTFLQRAQNGDELPGSTKVEENVANACANVFPIGATGQKMWNYAHHLWAGLLADDEDELVQTPLVLAAAKVCGPISTVSLDGKVLAASITIEGFDPAQHEFTTMEDLFSYIKALAAAAKKPDMDANPFTAEAPMAKFRPSSADGADKADEDVAVSDAGSEAASEAASEDNNDPCEKLAAWHKKEVKAALKKSGINTDLLDEDAFGENGGFDQMMNRTVKKVHNLATYPQKVARRNAALMIGVFTDTKDRAKEVLRAWSTDNRVDADVFGDEGEAWETTDHEGLYTHWSSRIGRYTTPEGRTVLFSAFPVGEDLAGTAHEGVVGRCCDAFVVVQEKKDGSKAKDFLDIGFGLGGAGKECPKHTKYPFLHDSNCEIFHLTADGPEALADKGPYYTATYASGNGEGGSNLDSLLKVRDDLIASAMCKHPSKTPSNGWDHPFTHIVAIGKSIVSSKKGKKNTEAAARVVLGSSGSSSESDD